ncbi:MAG TPA: agmatine deiminase family protein [Thermoanaerobaculia bacterium]|nr:agmatine deiminase family protein [Thermoanaerobaculia bacterium]
MPAEWEPHEATWIGWPHNATDWPGRFGPIPWAYAEIVRWLSRGEIVRILVQSRAHRERARRVLARTDVDPSRVEFFRIPTDRGWTRDSGPAFVRRDESPAEIAVARFRFNGWARYSDWRLDDRVPDRIAKELGLPVFPAEKDGRPVVLEGGAIDVNGRGSLLTTEECLLDPSIQVRNPGLTRQGYEEIFRDFLGAPNVIWLGRGIVGDDTHGHVDDVCRFVGPRTVVLCRKEEAGDENYSLLEENRERLEGTRLEDGSRVEVVAIPMPGPVVFEGRRLPASYANFAIAEAAVLVPTFNDPRDRIALGILGELFPDRPVVGIHATDLVWGLGTLHCLTRQQPTARPGGSADRRGPSA